MATYLIDWKIIIQIKSKKNSLSNLRLGSVRYVVHLVTLNPSAIANVLNIPRHHKPLIIHMRINHILEIC